MTCCDADTCAGATPPDTAGWRRALWIALAVNAGFCVTEILAGAAAGSTALQADALDFFGDAANYAISLGVVGMALTWRARAALAKGGTLLVFALVVGAGILVAVPTLLQYDHPIDKSRVVGKTPVPPQRRRSQRPDGLTEREAEVLQLLTRGCTNLEIAAKLVVSVHTVERHLQNAYRKISARNRADAAAYMARGGG